MKYLFVLGRNVELSAEEVKSFLNRTNNKIKNFKQNENAVLIETEKELDKNAIDRLGGVIAIGETADIHKEELYLGTSNKLNYVIWDYSDKTDKVREHLKRRFKLERLKATEKKLGRMIELQGGKTASTLSTRNLDEQFFTFDDEFGRIIQVCDYEKLEKRDMQKPVRRSELSISPRLAKIMINLSEVKKGKLVDGFCGIGAILAEALLQGIPVIGIDKDKDALDGAKKNLEWQEALSEQYRLIKADSRTVGIGSAEVMVSEPELGEILRRPPTKEKANETFTQFERLMISVINNLKKNISGRFVFSMPYIKVDKGRASCNAEEIAERTGLNLVLKIPEFRENQIVGREIVVLE